MVQAVYCGPEAELVGKTALLMALADKPGKVIAQFDDLTLSIPCGVMEGAANRSGGEVIAQPRVHLAFGWHEFFADDFDPFQE